MISCTLITNQCIFSYNNCHTDVNVCKFGDAEHEIQYSSCSDRAGIYYRHIIDHTAHGWTARLRYGLHSQ